MSNPTGHYSWPLSEADRAEIRRTADRERAEAFAKAGRAIVNWMKSALRSRHPDPRPRAHVTAAHADHC